MKPARLSLLFFALVAAGSLLSGCFNGCPNDSADLRTLPDFELSTSEGGTLSRSDLDGKVWVAAFIFTRCGGPCPQVSANMRQLQDDLKDQSDLRLVTITVDPEHDTAAVLKSYAENFKADPKRWYFLTGSKDKVYALIHDGFQLGVQENKGSARAEGSQFIHSSKLVLVDRKGRIRGYFDGRKIDDLGEPVTDVKRLKSLADSVLRESP